MDVEEHRARGVADVGDVASSVRQLPQEPRIDGAEREPARIGAGAGVRHVIEQPPDLAGREIRVDEQPGPLLHQLAGALGFQPFTVVGGPPVLPHGRVADRLAGLAVPEDRRFALVGNADGGNVAGAELRASERFDRDPDLRRPDLVRVVLDPAGARKDLPEFLLRDGGDVAAPVEVNRA